MLNRSLGAGAMLSGSHPQPGLRKPSDALDSPLSRYSWRQTHPDVTCQSHGDVSSIQTKQGQRQASLGE